MTRPAARAAVRLAAALALVPALALPTSGPAAAAPATRTYQDPQGDVRTVRPVPRQVPAAWRTSIDIDRATATTSRNAVTVKVYLKDVLPLNRSRVEAYQGLHVRAVFRTSQIDGSQTHRVAYHNNPRGTMLSSCDATQDPIGASATGDVIRATFARSCFEGAGSAIFYVDSALSSTGSSDPTYGVRVWRTDRLSFSHRV